MASPISASRIAVNVLMDGVLAALAVPLAGYVAAPALPALPPVTWALGAASLLLAGLPFRLSTQYWRFAGLADLLSVAGAALLGAALFTGGALFIGLALPSPTFAAILAMALLLLLGVPRIGYRLARERRVTSARAGSTRDVLLVGAGEGADLFIRALRQEHRPPFRVLGLIPLAGRQAGRRIHGVPILPTGLDSLAATLSALRESRRLPDYLVVTEEIGGPTLSALLDTAQSEGVAVRRAPRPTALQSAPESVVAEGAAPALALRPVAIEDLLNRPQVKLDTAGIARLISGRRVLVTGAGGTIGSELARQVASLAPAELVLVDNGEYALWQIDLELGESHPAVLRRACMADIRDAARLRAICAEYRPELVFHAAALKHVPIVEDNPLEGLRTNAVGTRNVANAAREAGARAMVLISTDKAVNPTSVMGASKRVAEMVCQGLDEAARGDAAAMRCVTVRFGNVLGSTGSVVPLFQRQLTRGGPLTVTHPDMQRYFMTVPEAVGLVLQASVAGADDEAWRGGIFVLDMGKPVKILDLARQMIRLAGLRPDVDVPITFTGLRPGEKLYEELFHGREPPSPTGLPGLLMASPRVTDPAAIGPAITAMEAACLANDRASALSLLAELVPEFDPQAGAEAAPLPATAQEPPA